MTRVRIFIDFWNFSSGSSRSRLHIHELKKACWADVDLDGCKSDLFRRP